MKTYKLYWTPCAAHCIDLMMEDLQKNASVARAIKDARSITNYVYNHAQLLAKIRESCKGDIVRPGATRFATNYLALESLRTHKAGLGRVFNSEWWSNHKLGGTTQRIAVEKIATSHTFWERVANTCQIFEPLYAALRFVDGEVYPMMATVFYMFQVMVETLRARRGCRWVVDIVEDRWSNQLLHPLHTAGMTNNNTVYFLNTTFAFN